MIIKLVTTINIVLHLIPLNDDVPIMMREKNNKNRKDIKMLTTKNTRSCSRSVCD